jgi:hypothetical protein
MRDATESRTPGTQPSERVGHEEAFMVCPKCGFEQPESAECARCGIFVTKFVEKRRLAEERHILDESFARKHAAYAGSQGAAIVDEDDFFAPEKKGIQHGIAGGIAMMAIAAIWFGLGWMAGIIFYYPPILFLIGAFAFLKGLFTGNVAGE